jgi:hypothetical protein
MNKLLLPCLLALVGCGGGTSFVKSDTTLGRVVVYRNGVAYFERYAKIDKDVLRLAVPADKVDDFLKSLTVIDAKTGDPAPISYPTVPQYDQNSTGLIDMDITLSGAGPHELKLSYVTEAPSWKPSYRVTIEKGGKVSVQAWAIVDNTSGEDSRSITIYGRCGWSSARRSRRTRSSRWRRRRAGRRTAAPRWPRRSGSSAISRTTRWSRTASASVKPWVRSRCHRAGPSS